MGFWNWKYNASDLADWFDRQDEKYWRDHDDWLIQSQRLGDAQPIFLFAAWYNDRFSTIGERVQHSLTGVIVDVLRLGNDFDFNSGWGVAKGAFLNLTRLAAVAGPISEVLGVGGRYAGVLATSDLKYIDGAEGPCAYVSVNNVLSFLKGRAVQLFATVEDIVDVRAANKGISMKVLLESPAVQSALTKLGVTFEQLRGINSIEVVLRAARGADGPVTFAIEWSKGGETLSHALTAVKDAGGGVRILDYVEEAEGGGVFKGFGSMAEMMKARPGWGPGFAQASLITDIPIRAFSSRYLKLLKFADGSFGFGVPVAMGMKWLKGANPDAKIFDMTRSVWRFVKSRNSDMAPPPQEPTVPPDIPSNVTSVSTVPDLNGKRLGVAPLAAEAGRAPRIDWLTGVQYRLKYLSYYKGPVNGANDQRTKNAVLAFQKDWFQDSKQWDSIPGPITQGALYAVLGW